MMERPGLFLDENIPASVAGGLRQRGVDVIHVEEAGLKGPIYGLERAPGGRHASIMHTDLCQGETDRNETRS